MNFISEEEQQELIYGFIRFAYEEMQTDGWISRRNEFRLRHHMTDTDIDGEIILSFPETMNKIYNGDLNMTLERFFCHEISSFGWFDAYCFHQRPDLDTRDKGQYFYYWKFNQILYKWIDTEHKIGEYVVGISEMLIDILELDFCLK